MRYFFAFLATVGLIIIVIILLLSGGGSDKKTPVTVKTLPEYANTDAETTIIIDGPINADSLHNQVQIHVGRDQVTYEQIQGFNGNVVASNTFANNQNAYSAFLHALDYAGFTLKSKETTTVDGRCPTGTRYSYLITQDGKNLQNSWSTSCGPPSTFLGNASLTRTLFQAQVPNYSTLTSNLGL